MKAFAEWIETFIVPNPWNFIALSLAVVVLGIAAAFGLAAILI